MIGGELLAALDGESDQGVSCLVWPGIARERVAGLDCRMTVVSIGDDAPMLTARYNLDGKPITVN